MNAVHSYQGPGVNGQVESKEPQFDKARLIKIAGQSYGVVSKILNSVLDGWKVRTRQNLQLKEGPGVAKLGVGDNTTNEIKGFITFEKQSILKYISEDHLKQSESFGPEQQRALELVVDTVVAKLARENTVLGMLPFGCENIKSLKQSRFIRSIVIQAMAR